MGIQGLLQALRPYSETVHVKKYSGQRVGIDAYSWLHKGAYACGMELHLDNARSKRWKVPVYVSYCLHRIKMLKYNNVTPVVVFDGGPLPLKASTEQERRRRRETNLENAQKKHAEGDMLGAQELFQRAVEVTPAMAHELIEVLREEGVEFVVAPYEADAQLAYLAGLPRQKGGIAAVISEDSDLLAYGCKAVLFKMDRYGQCEEIGFPKLLECDPPPLKALTFSGFTQDLFLGMCVMAGCDFLASIPGIGVKRAHGLVAKYRNIFRVLSKLKFERPTTFPENYMADFSQAKAIFSHARVYDRQKRELVFLNPLPEELRKEFEGNLEFLGPDLPQSRAKAIAEGRLDPITMEAFNSIPSSKTPALTNSIGKEIRKNMERALPPVTPLSMYGSRRKSPKLSKSGSFLSRNGSKPALSPGSPFAMFTAKDMLRIFDSPRKQTLYTSGRNESFNITDSEVEDTQVEVATSSLSEVSRRAEEMDDGTAGSQVTVTYEQTISETQVSISRRAINEATETDQNFLAQLKCIAGCGLEARIQNSASGFPQATSSGREMTPNNLLKRKMVETSSDSLHLTLDNFRPSSGEAQRNDEESHPSSCLSAEESNITRLRETSGDESKRQIVSPDLVPANFRSLMNDAELASQTGSVGVQSADGEDDSPLSVLTEISPNFEVVEDSLSDSIAPAGLASSLPAHQSKDTISVKSTLAKSNRPKSNVPNDRNRRGGRARAQNSSPTNLPGGGILKFFKPVTQ